MEFVWTDGEGKKISCTEKNKMLYENMEEILQVLRNSYEDAVLMGVSSESFMSNTQKLINECCNLKT